MRWRMLGVMTIAQICGAVVQQGLGSLAPFILITLHLNKAQLGLVFTAMVVGSGMTAAVSGIAVDRWGERSMTLWSGIALGSALLACALFESYLWLLFTLFIVGVAYSAQTPAGGRAILTWFDRDRGFAMSIRQMGVPVGAVVGGLVLPFLASKGDYRTAMIGGAFFAIAGGLVAGIVYRDPRGGPPAPQRLSALLGGMRAIAADARTITFVLACLALVSAQQVMNAFLAITAITRAHTSIAVAAVIFAGAQVAAAVGRLAWGWISDRVFHGDRALPVAVICALVSFAAFGLSLADPSNLLLLVICALAIGFGGAGWNGVFATALAEIGGTRFAGSALGVGLTAIFLVGGIAPFLFGALADHQGIPLAWMVLSGFSALGIVPALMARRAFLAFEGGGHARG